MLAASPQGSSPAENWDFRMLKNATTTNDSVRAVNVRRPAAEQFYAVALAAQCKIRVVPSEGIQDDRDLYSNGTHHKGDQWVNPAGCLMHGSFHIPCAFDDEKVWKFRSLEKRKNPTETETFLSTYYHSTMPLAY